MQTDIQKAFTQASKQLFLLDYDGTLREFEKDPLAATPTEEIKALLRGLGSTPGIQVVLISGRNHDLMETWFGGLPVSMVAEHGFFVKMKDAEWTPAMDMDESWKPVVREVFERYGAQVPLSTTEEKHSAIAWHYRASDATVADPMAEQALQVLTVLAKALPITIVPGHQVLEVHIKGIDKGVAAKQFLDTATGSDNKPYDFILAAGDDTTDEDLFKAMPEGAFTVKVGDGDTDAKLHVSNPAGLRILLKQLA